MIEKQKAALLLHVTLCFFIELNLLNNLKFVLTQEVESNFTKPAPFRDEFLFSVPPSGFQLNNLGRIVQLSKTFKPKEVATRFSIYSRNVSVEDVIYEPKKDSNGTIHQFDLERLYLSDFNPNRRTIIMVPGFLTDDRPSWILETKDLWLKLEDVNVIMVTWKDGNRPFYHGAVANTPVVARQISSLLYYLTELHGGSIKDGNFLDRIELIGHSLGAHISGFVGKDFMGQLGRITGLDPAGPDFDRMTRFKRLDRYDAKLVTVIHSNRGWMDFMKLAADGIKSYFSKKNDNQIENIEEQDNIKEEDVPTHFGIDQQLGDIDYYMNNGRQQPGCEGILYICDHGRSTVVYRSILEYESQIRENININSSSLTTDDWLEQNRLLAFRSDDYSDFASGISFNEQCPAILDKKKLIIDQDHGNGTTNFENCVVPIDLISPARKVRDELEKEFRLDFDKSNNNNPNSRYWFKTLPTEPFVGKHYMLRVELDKQSSLWNETCGLIAQVEMANGFNLTMKVDRDTRLIDDINFYGLALPFTNPSGVEAISALDNIIDKVTRSQHNIVKLLAKLIPTKIKLTIVSKKKRDDESDDKNLNVRNEEESDESTPNSSSCKVVVKSTEVKPIDFDVNLIGSYNNKPGKERSLFKKGISKGRRLGRIRRGQNRRELIHQDERLNVLSVEDSPTIVRYFDRLAIPRQ